jgi:hypothetical protein
MCATRSEVGPEKYPSADRTADYESTPSTSGQSEGPNPKGGRAGPSVFRARGKYVVTDLLGYVCALALGTDTSLGETLS